MNCLQNFLMSNYSLRIACKTFPRAIIVYELLVKLFHEQL